MEHARDAIFCDNRTEGRWFQRLDPRLEKYELVVLRSREANLDSKIADLLAYDRPDIILMTDGEPVLVVEKTREVPTGHNVGQRMARLVRAIELGVPTIKFFPFDAMKHGKYAGPCFLNARLLLAFERITEIHSCPLLAVNWPSDSNLELVDDGSEDERMRELVAGGLDSSFDPFSPGFESQIEFMDEEYRRRTTNDPRYTEPPKSVRIMQTDEALDHLDIAPGDLHSSLSTTEESLVYQIGMTPAKCRREDPYTGTQFIYDYVWCRSGSQPSEKHRNLILHFPLLEQETFIDRNPNDPSRKSCNWYLTATALAFNDGAIGLHLPN